MPDPLLTMDGALAALGCSEAELWRRVDRGQVVAYRVGRLRRFCLTPQRVAPAKPQPPAAVVIPRRLTRWDEVVLDGVAESLHLNGSDINEERPIVYVLQAGEGGPLKIGWTADLKRLRRRLRAIQTGAHADIVIRRLFQGEPGLERALHKRHRPARIRGEWFRPTAAMLALVTKPGLEHLPTFDQSASVSPLRVVKKEAG